MKDPKVNNKYLLLNAIKYTMKNNREKRNKTP